MSKELLDALEICLQRMEQGEALDSVLERYPHLAAQLRPLLETATLARSAGRESMPLTSLARQRSRGLDLAADLRQGKHRRLLQGRFWRPVMTVLSVLAILVMSSNGLLIASAHSLPGDTLYPLKRSVESTQLHLVFDPAERQVLERTFDERRVEETRSLITDQRVESVEFTGVVSSQSENEWLVSGIAVVVSSHTEMDEGILVGDEIDVHGATNALGGVDASRLSLAMNSATNEEHPRVSPTPTPAPDPSGESSLQETPAGSSVALVHSSEDGNQPGDGNDYSSAASHESHSYDETIHTPQHDSGGGGDS